MLLAEITQRSPVNTKAEKIKSLDKITQGIKSDSTGYGMSARVLINSTQHKVTKIFSMGSQIDNSAIDFVNIGLSHNNPFLPYIYRGLLIKNLMQGLPEIKK